MASISTGRPMVKNIPAGFRQYDFCSYRTWCTTAAIRSAPGRRPPRAGGPTVRSSRVPPDGFAHELRACTVAVTSSTGADHRPSTTDPPGGPPEPSGSPERHQVRPVPPADRPRRPRRHDQPAAQHQQPVGQRTRPRRGSGWSARPSSPAPAARRSSPTPPAGRRGSKPVVGSSRNSSVGRPDQPERHVEPALLPARRASASARRRRRSGPTSASTSSAVPIGAACHPAPGRRSRPR